MTANYGNVVDLSLRAALEVGYRLPTVRLIVSESQLCDALEVWAVEPRGLQAMVAVAKITMVAFRGDPATVVHRAMVRAHDHLGECMGARAAICWARHHRPHGVP